MHAAHQDEEDEDGGAESELDESESEVEVIVEEEKERVQEEENMAAGSHKYATTLVMAPTGIKGRQKTHAKSSEEVEAQEYYARSKQQPHSI